MRKLQCTYLLIFVSFTLSSQNLIVEGNAGIGTSEVGKALEVYGNILTKSSSIGGYATSFSTGSDGVTSFWTNDNYNPANHTSGWKRVINLKNQMVGIGTTNPSYRLNVYDFGNSAIFGQSNNGDGVVGKSVNGRGIYATSTGNNAIEGFSQIGIGVYGRGGDSDFWAHNGTYGNSSSRRWKSNIKNITDPLKKLSNIRGVYFDWDEEHGGKHAVGFIAEEVGEVFPEVVFYEENGVDAKGMDYTKMTPLLVEAVNAMRKEYQEKFDKQEKEILALRSELEEIKSLLSGASKKVD